MDQFNLENGVHVSTKTYTEKLHWIFKMFSYEFNHSFYFS